jgi:heme/copper-type cytochrome/quinol oxidase subunit 1
MTTLDVHTAASPPATARTAADHRSSSGLLATVGEWFVTTDHKRIGRMYVSLSLLFAVAAAAAGVLLGVEALGDDSLLKGSLEQVATAYRTGLTFAVVVPLMLGVATAVSPLQLGARSIAFGRVAAMGLWMWLAGVVLIGVALAANGGPGGGDRQAVLMFLTAHMLMLIGLLAGAVSLVTSIMTTRAPGMNMRRIPPFTWSALVFGIGLVLVLPVAIGTMLYNYLGFRYAVPGWNFTQDVTRWIGFATSQPASFVYVLPALGVAVETVAVSSRRRLPMRGFFWSGIGLAGVVAFGAVTQNRINLRAGFLDASFNDQVADVLPFLFFNLLPVLGAFIVLALIPLAFKGGRPAITAPLLFGLLGLTMVFVGMLANVIHSVDDLDIFRSRFTADGSFAGIGMFDEGVWLYAMYGGLLAGLGALLHWSPKLFGVVAPTKLAAPVALLGVGGTVVSSLPLLIGAILDDFGDAASALSAVGHAMIALTVVAVVGLTIKAARAGERAAADPWDGHTLEWAAESPAPADNFGHVRTVTSAEPLLDLKPTTEHAS